MVQVLKNMVFPTHCQPFSLATLSPITPSSPPSLSEPEFNDHLLADCNELNFKIVEMVTMTIVGSEGRKDDPRFRKSYSIKEKRELVQSVQFLMSARNVTVRQACLLIGVSPMYYTRFKRIIKKIDDIENGEVFIPYKTNGSARKVHPGGRGFLADVKEELSRFVFETRQLGIQVSTRMVRQEAGRLLPDFRNKTIEVQKKVVARFVKSMGLTHRSATHTAQKNFQETKDESVDFIALMKEKVAGVNPEDILNMDQTPIPYSFHTTRTLEKKGSKTVNVRASTTDTKRVTLAVSVEASGRMLPPMLVFRGAPNGHIANREFGTFPDGGHYACQKKAWMDEDMMNKWIDLVLVPWKNAKEPEIIPIIILDAYRVHMMGNIVNRIQSLGIEVVHIPPGCTYLCQPVDVGLNKTIKTGMREKWEDWMMEGSGIVDGAAKEPSRKLVAEWIVEVYSSVPQEIGRNAWMKKGFEWF